MIHTDFPPVPECRHPEWSYGMICVKCGACGRFGPKWHWESIRQSYSMFEEGDSEWS